MNQSLRRAWPIRRAIALHPRVAVGRSEARLRDHDRRRGDLRQPDGSRNALRRTRPARASRPDRGPRARGSPAAVPPDRARRDDGSSPARQPQWVRADGPGAPGRRDQALRWPISSRLGPMGLDRRSPSADRSRPRRGGLTSRQLLRRSIAAAIGIWVAELAGGTIGFLWSAAAAGPAKVRIGTLDDLIAANSGLPVADGFPAYVPEARAFIMTIDPGPRRVVPGLRPDRRRHGPQRACRLADLSAPRLSAEPVHRGLLVPLPVPPVALRPARHQAGGDAVRAGGSVDGPLRDRGRRGRRPDRRHVARRSSGPLPDRAGPAGRASRHWSSAAAAGDAPAGDPRVRACSGSTREPGATATRRRSWRSSSRLDLGPRARLDLARGAVDARLHAGSRLPAAAALLSGGAVDDRRGAASSASRSRRTGPATSLDDRCR